MTVGELEALFRIQFDDSVKPYLISSDVFVEYLNEAQIEACIRSRLIFDRSSPICNINVDNSHYSYLIDEQIYAIVDAFITDLSGNVVRLDITDRIALDNRFQDWRESKNGVPKYLIQYDDHIELSPIPDNSYTLNIECQMLPEKLSESGSPQIGIANHRNLLHWVYYRAYGVQDNDVTDSSKSFSALAMFEKVFGTYRTASNTRNQYTNTPHRNKVCL